jgi:DNA polymerase
MDQQRRSRYLRALDIGVWTRDAGAPTADVERPPVIPTPSVSHRAVPHSVPTRIAEPKFHERTPPQVVAVPAAAVSAPREIPKDWPGLQQAVAGCTACKLCRTRTNTVFGVGSETAPLMVIGEGPGADEDAQGFPFVGRAGKLLDEMLKAIGRSRGDTDPAKAVYIANVVKCRPPNNRDPENDEVDACRPYLDAQIEHVKPKLILALGRIAAQRLLSSDAPLSKLRGPQHEYGERRTPVLITYHPAYLLRSPGEKAKSWADLKHVHRFLTQA